MHRSADRLATALSALDARQLRRQRAIVQAPRELPAPGLRVQINGREFVNFCSNDYLGLAQHPALAAAASAALRQYGTGAGAAHLVSGHCEVHNLLEQELAAFTGRERALLFSTGYMANLGVLAAFAGRGECVLQDRLNHASLLDGARLAGARLLRYAHADATAAERLLREHPATCLVATDGVFSMDGDLAPLAPLAAAARAARAWLLVDDAHGLGVLGDTGGGLLEHLALDSAEVPLLMGTLGKALGCFGAFVAGDAEVIEWLLQQARTYRYTTALPPAIAAAARAALQVVRDERWRRERLHEHIAYWRDGLAARALPWPATASAIQPLVVGDSAAALRMAAALSGRGFWVSAIRPPTVPEGTARLRVTLSAAHERAAIDALLDALADARERS